ncbi:hypothetical protein Nit79A3_2695 [Nitrosomonas sp. Is79A3]|uniref:DUF4396 domain-containing protein n=1 Tax=Nitrosomonas sp. (strain Is79A3) TaxID=261292 RepID=UPI000215D10C
MKKHLHHNHKSVKEQSLNSVALIATVHCLSGCAIGEVAGIVIGTALGWSNAETIALAIVLAFLSGYLLTMLPMLRSGYGFGAAARIVLASDTASIAIMEIIDNLMMLMIPGAMNAPLDSLLFWSSLTIALVITAAAAFPVNRWLIAQGRGHALAHTYH